MEEEVLWREYRLTGDHYSRDQLIEKYLPYAFSLARKKKISCSVEIEDLESAGVIGLIQAVERYDPEAGIRFKTFAWYRIIGAIQDYLRGSTYKRIQPPRMQRFQEEPATNDANPTAALEKEESFEVALRILCKTERERTILDQYYRNGHSLLKISQSFGLSEGRMSQILKRCLERVFGEAPVGKSGKSWHKYRARRKERQGVTI